MLELVTTGQFRKDYKRVKRRGYNMQLLEEILETLLNQQPLATSCHDHALTGNYTGFRECHVSPDWLLIYSVNENQLILTASRTGGHSDLFQK